MDVFVYVTLAPDCLVFNLMTNYHLRIDDVVTQTMVKVGCIVKCEMVVTRVCLSRLLLSQLCVLAHDNLKLTSCTASRNRK